MDALYDARLFTIVTHVALDPLEAAAGEDGGPAATAAAAETAGLSDGGMDNMEEEVPADVTPTQGFVASKWSVCHSKPRGRAHHRDDARRRGWHG